VSLAASSAEPACRLGATRRRSGCLLRSLTFRGTCVPVRTERHGWRDGAGDRGPMASAGGDNEGRQPGLFTRPAFVVVLVLVVFALAAAGAGAYRNAAANGAVTAPKWLGALVTALFIDALVLLVISAIRGGGRGGRAGGQAQGTKRKVTWFEALIAAAIVFGVVLLALVFRHPAQQPKQKVQQATPTLQVLGHPKGNSQDWVLIGVLVACTLVAFLAYRWWRRRRARLAELEGGVEEEGANVLASAAHLTLAEVQEEPDPRQAVILAYRRMEELLGDSGVPREPWETPYEYLERVFARLGAPSALAARLTDLYEFAKFGHHKVDESARDAALAALHELTRTVVPA
jgi:hypothetical protein